MIRPTRVEIDLNAVVHNTAQIRRLIGPERKLLAMVKANGYGHGAVQVSRAALEGGADFLGVAIPEEGVELRDAGIEAPVIVMALSPLAQADCIVKNDLSQAICTEEMALAIDRAARKVEKKAKVHLKVDTGMGRIGIPPKEAFSLIQRISGLSHLEIEGIYTHFSEAESMDPSFTMKQVEAFMVLCGRLRQEGIDIPLRHMANSAALIGFPEILLDMVRPGLIIYGLYPSPELKSSIALRPVMAFKTEIAYVKSIPEGTSISYGRTFISDRPMRVATMCAGYADGYSRHLSNKGEVLVRGKRARILGKVCMDMIVIDVSDIPDADVGDEVVLFGTQQGEQIEVDEIADRIGTINYEVVCGIGQRVPRIYIWEGKGKQN